MTIFLELAALALLGLLILIIVSGFRFIPNTRIGIVEKRYSSRQGAAGAEKPLLRPGGKPA